MNEKTIDVMPNIQVLSASPFHTVTRVEVWISANPEDGQIYQVDTARIGGRWVEMYTLTKLGLDKLFIACGVQTKKSGAKIIAPGIWEGYFEGVWTSLEGTPTTLQASKQYDLRIGGTRHQAKAQKHENALLIEWAESIGRKRAENESMDEYIAKIKFYLTKNNPEKFDEIKFIATEIAGQAIITQAVFGAELAETGAALRATRRLLQIRKYTIETIKNCPFVVYRVRFDWDKVTEKLGMDATIALMAGKVAQDVLGDPDFLKLRSQNQEEKEEHTEENEDNDND